MLIYHNAQFHGTGFGKATDLLFIEFIQQQNPVLGICHQHRSQTVGEPLGNTDMITIEHSYRAFITSP